MVHMLLSWLLMLIISATLLFWTKIDESDKLGATYTIDVTFHFVVYYCAIVYYFAIIGPFDEHLEELLLTHHHPDLSILPIHRLRIRIQLPHLY